MRLYDSRWHLDTLSPRRPDLAKQCQPPNSSSSVSSVNEQCELGDDEMTGYGSTHNPHIIVQQRRAIAAAVKSTVRRRHRPAIKLGRLATAIIVSACGMVFLVAVVVSLHNKNQPLMMQQRERRNAVELRQTVRGMAIIKSGNSPSVEGGQLGATAQPQPAHPRRAVQQPREQQGSAAAASLLLSPPSLPALPPLPHPHLSPTQPPSAVRAYLVPPHPRKLPQTADIHISFFPPLPPKQPSGCAQWCTQQHGHCNWEHFIAQCACAACSFCRSKAEATLLSPEGERRCPQFKASQALLRQPKSIAISNGREPSLTPPLPVAPSPPCLVPPHWSSLYVSRRRGMLWRDGQPYRFVGANVFYLAWLGAEDSGDQARLKRELDRLQALGVTNVRLLAAAEGPDQARQPCAEWCREDHGHCMNGRWDTHGWQCECTGCSFCNSSAARLGGVLFKHCPGVASMGKIVPSLQPFAGIVNEYMLRGLDYALDALASRGMNAVLILNNMWAWSGGFASYVLWATGEAPPRMGPDATDADWQAHQDFASRFYGTAKAVEIWFGYIRQLLGRRNSVNGRLYREDPAIMAWELANEPRALKKKNAYQTWIRQASGLIKSLDCLHLVTLGSEGATAFPSYVNNNLQSDHEHVDFVTLHIWPQNYLWYNPMTARDVGQAFAHSKAYIEAALNASAAMGKPLVIEEFGIARDNGSHSTTASTKLRDAYFKQMCTFLASTTSQTSGLNFWSWAGEGRPRAAKTIWQPGDEWTGDPPHERQGWYSVYDTDRSTLTVLTECSSLFAIRR